MLLACRSQKIGPSAEGFVGCDNLPGLRFQNQSDTIVASRISGFALEAAAAAQRDANSSDSLPRSGAFAAMQAQTGRVINQRVAYSSSVTTEFWQQDIVFRQVICFLERQSEKKTVPNEEKQMIRKSILDIVTARSKYLTQIQNKWPEPVLRVDPFSKDTLQFRISNISTNHPLVLENIYFGLISCSGNPANLAGGGIKRLEIIDLPAADIRQLSEPLSAVAITREKFEIPQSQTSFFQLPYARSEVKAIADSAASYKCRNPTQIFGELGEMYLFATYVNPITGRSEKLSQLIYKGIAKPLVSAPR